MFQECLKHLFLKFEWCLGKERNKKNNKENGDYEKGRIVIILVWRKNMQEDCGDYYNPSLGNNYVRRNMMDYDNPCFV